MKSIWNFFASIRLSVVVLLTIAVASIAGTLIPQNQSPREYVAAFGDPLYRVFATLDMFDMYHSWWFQTLLLLLTVNIVVCSLDRWPVTWKAVFPKASTPNPAKFRNLRNRETFDSGLSMDVLTANCQRLASGGGIHSTPDGFFLLEDKGRWTRFGVYGVHLSVILLLVGALIGSIYGFDGFVNIAEGESVSSVRINSAAGGIKPLDFELRCDDFSVTFYPSGMPREYRSRLTVIEDGRPVLQKEIIVNDPLRYGGINIFQSSYGQLPPERAVLSFAGRETGREYKQSVKVGEVVTLPEGLGTFRLMGYRDSIDFRGRDVGAAFLGMLTPIEGEPETIMLPVQFPTFDQMRKGAVAVSVSSFAPVYYTGLQVTRDPGVWVVYAGFILLIVGCFVTFFTSHHRLFIEVVRHEGRHRVTVAGMANKNKLGMKQKVGRIAGRLRKEVNSE